MPDTRTTSTSAGRSAVQRRLASELEFLLGRWSSAGGSAQGQFDCQRTFEPALEDSCLRMTATWRLGASRYEEHAYLTVDADGRLQWWAFASDGRHSFGSEDDVSDIHPRAVGFSARLSDGAARQAWWRTEDGSLHWVVETRSGSSWRRLIEHRYVHWAGQ